MLVSVAELCDYMDIKFSVRQQRAAEYVLSGLQSELESYLRRTIEPVTQTETHVVPAYETATPSTSFFYDPSLDVTATSLGFQVPPITVYSRNSPISNAGSVYITNPTSASPVPQLQTENTDYVVRRWGIDLYRALPNDEVTFTYTSGLDGQSIDVFRLLILRAASREMQNMHDDTVGLKDLQTRNVAPLQTGFTDVELKSVKRWRHHRVAG